MIEPSKRILLNLSRAGVIRGCTAVIMAGSDSDMPHLETLAKELGKYKVPSQIRICSAHKQPAQLQAVLENYNKSIEPVMIIGCAGGTDALSGTASYLSRHPVVSCPDVAAALEASTQEKIRKLEAADEELRKKRA